MLLAWKAIPGGSGNRWAPVSPHWATARVGVMKSIRGQVAEVVEMFRLTLIKK